MSVKAGIVGLQNVGKSTLFNAITNSHVEAANYPFATINPNDGVVPVKDKRLDFLSSIFNPKRKIYTTVEFYDIAGLVKGASKGEGLGNKFLSHIRECDIIVHLVRCFDSKDVIHVEDSVDPIRDIEIINLELILADLETCCNRIGKVENKARVSKDKEAIFEMNILSKVKDALEKGISIRKLNFADDEKKYVQKTMNFLTAKPVIYVANVSDSDYSDINNCKYYLAVKNFADKENSDCVYISCEIEYEISQLKEEEKAEYFNMLGIEESGLNTLISKTYSLLNLSTFFTVGEDECRAWTFVNGMTAPQCAGIIHSDFQKGFIRAEVYSYEDFVVYKSEAALKNAGKIRIEGKDYLAKDGDIFFFRFNV